MSYTHRFEPTPEKRIETDKLVEILKSKNERFLFTGDLNALPGSYTVSEVEKHLKNAGPDFDAKTWTTKPFSYNGFEASTLDWRLDYVFATPDVQIKAAKVLETPYSDHLPILVEF